MVVNNLFTSIVSLILVVLWGIIFLSPPVGTKALPTLQCEERQCPVLSRPKMVRFSAYYAECLCVPVG
jgi:hypothetical protein